MAPSCVPSVQPVSEATQQEAVAACLERLKPGHFQAKRLAFEIRDVGFTPAGTLDTLQLLVRWIFDRAMTDPERFSAPCAALCFSLTPILPTFKPPGAVTAAAKAKRIDFRQTLLNLCQREFESACVSLSQLDATTKATASSLAGSLQFLGYLYLHHLLTDRIMLSCLLMVSSAKGAGGQGGAGSDAAGTPAGCQEPQRVECLVKALLIAGRQLDECLAEQHRPLLDGLYDQLRAAHACGADCAAGEGGSPSSLTPELRAQLDRLLGLRAAGWPRTNGVEVGGPTSKASHAASAGAPGGGNGFAAGPGAPVFRLPKGVDGVVTAAAVRPSKGLSHTAAAAPAAAASAPSKAGASGPPATSAAPASGGSASSNSRGDGGGGGAAASSSGAAEAAGGLAGAEPLQRLGSQHRRALSGSSNNLNVESRPSNQNLEGLWDLTPDTYNEVRGQLLSQPIANSPATLEAMADELVESAVAASGGDSSCPCWGGSAGSAAASGATAGATPCTDAEWAQQVQQQWEEQCRACDIYIRLCVDALQQMSSTSPSGPPPGVTGTGAGAGSGTSGNGVAAAEAASGSGGGASSGNSSNGAGDVSRAFRRLLLSSAQSHFERCLAELQLPPAPAPASAPAPPPPQQQQQPQRQEQEQQEPRPSASAQQPEGTAARSHSPSSSSSPFTSEAAAANSATRTSATSTSTSTAGELAGDLAAVGLSSPTAADGTAAAAAVQLGGGGAGAVNGARRAWADLPAFVPDAAAVVAPRARGVCHLLLGLLRHGILTPRIVLHCAAALVDGAAGGSVPCLECACILLAGAGKQARTFKVAEAAAFESLVKRLQGLTEANSRGGASAAASATDAGAAANGAAAARSAAAGREQRRRFVAWLIGGLRAR